MGGLIGPVTSVTSSQPPYLPGCIYECPRPLDLIHCSRYPNTSWPCFPPARSSPVPMRTTSSPAPLTTTRSWAWAATTSSTAGGATTASMAVMAVATALSTPARSISTPCCAMAPISWCSTTATLPPMESTGCAMWRPWSSPAELNSSPKHARQATMHSPAAPTAIRSMAATATTRSWASAATISSTARGATTSSMAAMAPM